MKWTVIYLNIKNKIFKTCTSLQKVCSTTCHSLALYEVNLTGGGVHWARPGLLGDMPERRCILQLCLVAWQPARGLNTWVQTHREPWLVTAVSHFVTDWQSRELPLKEVPLKFECKFALRYVHAWSYFFWLSATLWPFDEISEDRRTHTLTLEHPVPKSLSNMALLKYYGCLLFFKCSQMYPTKDLFQVLKQSQKSLFIFTVMHRQKNIAVVNLVSTSCVRSERCPSACDVCVRGGWPLSLSTLICFGGRRRQTFYHRHCFWRLTSCHWDNTKCSLPLYTPHPAEG